MFCCAPFFFSLRRVCVKGAQGWGGIITAALQRTAANGRKVWECFMLGVDPMKADDDFRITRSGWRMGSRSSSSAISPTALAIPLCLASNRSEKRIFSIRGKKCRPAAIRPSNSLRWKSNCHSKYLKSRKLV